MEVSKGEIALNSIPLVEDEEKQELQTEKMMKARRQPMAVYVKRVGHSNPRARP